MRFFLTFTKENLLSFFFFVFLGISIFLGDGKQPFVDSYLGVGILVIYFIAYLVKLKFRHLSKSIYILWILSIVYFLIRTVFSDSVGYSISATIRIIEAFLVYVLFFSLANNKTIKNFINGLETLAVIAVVCSVFLIFFPGFTKFLPSMNLLYSTYGHNHLVDLLLFVLPLTFLAINKKSDASSKFFSAVVFLGILISFSRGAWFLVAVYTVYRLFNNRLYGWIRFAALVSVTIFMSWLILDGAIFSVKSPKVPTSTADLWLKRQIVKPPLWQDPRLVYWKQALTAISERPWLGSGPGTFYLESKRLQDRTDSYSWFAHSFPLETIVELGVVGALPFFMLVLYLGRLFISQLKNKEEKSIYLKPLFLGLSLVFVYSFFEYNLNFLTIILIFWATMGLLAGFASKQKADQRSLWLVFSGILSVLIFSVTGLMSLIFGLNNHLRLAHLISPYNLQVFLNYLSGPTNNADVSLGEYFFQGNSEVLYSLAKNYQKFNLKISWRDLFVKILYWDPLNYSYHRDYVYFLASGKADNKKIAGEIKNVSLLFLPKNLAYEINQTPFNFPGLLSFYTLDNLKLLESAPYPSAALSKFFYMSGLAIINKNPKTTEKFWNLATKSSPEWSYYHIELASLRLQYLSDNMGAEETLKACQNYETAKKECVLMRHQTLPPPGFFKKKILSIPALTYD